MGVKGIARLMSGIVLALARKVGSGEVARYEQDFSQELPPASK
jgi:hypothetical protein